MNIGIIVTIVGSFGKKGFYNSQEIGLGKALAKQGHTVLILKCIDKNFKYEKEQIAQNLEIEYLPVTHLGAHGYLPGKYIKSNFDAILAFSDTQIFVPHIYRFCKRNKITFVPYIGIAHSFQQNIKSKFMDALFKITTLRIYQKIPVIAKTSAAKDELKNLGVKTCNVAPVGLDTSKLNLNFRESDREALKMKYGFNKDDCIICFVARLKPEKRPVDLIHIFENIKDEGNRKLLIVGEGPEREQIDMLINKYNIMDRVKIFEKINYENMWEIHYISDYFVNLRAEEIFGMAVLEAVYYETSVAAIDAPGPSTILQGMKGHKICFSDLEIENWIKSEYPNEKYLRESSEKILENFTWEACAKTFVDMVKGN